MRVSFLLNRKLMKFLTKRKSHKWKIPQSRKIFRITDTSKSKSFKRMQIHSLKWISKRRKKVFLKVNLADIKKISFN